MELWEQPLSRRRFLGTAAAAAVGARPLARAALAASTAAADARPLRASTT